MNMWKRTILILLLWLPLQTAAQDGIFADFETSLGDFTCKLDPAAAPATVASFIGLATGDRPWLDEATGVVRNDPFYDGITFHRTIANNIIQAGSPNGQGTDGAGFIIPDEFFTLRTHDVPYVLSMANTGAARFYSGGSQFFITLIPRPGLDFLHSVFGEVTAGTNVVHAIGDVAVDSNDRPLTPVTINKVTIRRVGTAAEAFDIDAQGLPDVTALGHRIDLNTNNIPQIHFDRAANREIQAFCSVDQFLTWSNYLSEIFFDFPPTEPLVLHVDHSNHTSAVYRGGATQYPGDSIHAPATLSNRTITATLSSGAVIVVAVDGTGEGGTVTINGTGPGGGPPADIIDLFDLPCRYHRWLGINSAGFVGLDIRLHYTSPSGGFFNGRFLTSPPFGGVGTFTISPP